MERTNFFMLEEVEEVKSPCVACFWGGAALVACAVIAAAT